MLKTGDSKKWLGTMLAVLAVLVFGITATGYADPTERVSGPAVVGTLDVIGSTVIFNGHCRGILATFTATFSTFPGSLEGLRLEGIGQTVCPPQPSNVVIVKNVMNGGSTTNAKVVLLWVVSQ